MSARHITFSTVVLSPAVRKLVKEAIPVTLAVSLHAPDDELRDELVPINTRFDVDEILSAAHEYFEATGRRVSIEYALIRDKIGRASCREGGESSEGDTALCRNLTSG